MAKIAADIKERTPHARFQDVDVVFPADPYTDVEVRHTLSPSTPEHIDYEVLRRSQACTIYHDQSGTRRPWETGVIRLRSNIGGARATLRLSVTDKPRVLDQTAPSAVTPAVLAHTHDAADVVSGTLATARIPNLDASKITTGTLDAARIPNLDASKITTGTMARARIPSELAYEDEANTFTQAQTMNALLTLAGGQLAFPSSQNASANANTLDDYEEGSWTPVIGGSGGTSGQSYSSQSGSYIKIGRLVIAHYGVTLSAKGTITTSVEIQGLPFVAEGSSFPIGSLQWGSLATNWVNLITVVVAGSAAARVRGTTAAAASNGTDLTTADINNTTGFFGTIAYFASN